MTETTREAMERAMGPDNTRQGIFRDHNCWKCQNGKLPCVTPPGQGGCEYPRARNE